MKKSFLLLILLFLSLVNIAQAQNVFPSSGNVGIGTDTPAAKVQIEGTGDYDAILRLTNKGSGGGDWSLVSTNSNWTAGSNSLLFTNGDPKSVNGKFIISSNGKVGIGTFNLADSFNLFVTGGANIDQLYTTSLGIGVKSPSYSRVQIEGSGTYDAILRLTNTGTGGGDWSLISTDSAWSAGTQNLLFCYGYPSSANTKVVFTSTGKIGIDTYNFVGSHALYVGGSILSEGITVKPLSQWSDFVFSRDYNLQSLSKVADYIHKNHHLPGIPSAKEIESKGLNLGDMEKRQMQKIEELTLYQINADREIKQLHTEIDEYKNELSEMKKEIKQLQNALK